MFFFFFIKIPLILTLKTTPIFMLFGFLRYHDIVSKKALSLQKTKN